MDNENLEKGIIVNAKPILIENDQHRKKKEEISHVSYRHILILALFSVIILAKEMNELGNSDAIRVYESAGKTGQTSQKINKYL